jgi:hypothetical protein
MAWTRRPWAVLIVLGFLLGCSTAPPALPGQPSTLTPGMVEKTLREGETSQNQVISSFGAPNIITRDESGLEVWTYDVHSVAHAEASTARSGAGAAGAGGIAGSVPIVGGVTGGGGKSTSAGQVSSSTFTLMITFDDQDRVKSYRMQSTRF